MNLSRYSFCESINAICSKWHIRRLSDAGSKPGGGIDTPTLCGRRMSGWDIVVAITEAKLEGRKWVCDKCLAELRLMQAAEAAGGETR